MTKLDSFTPQHLRDIVFIEQTFKQLDMKDIEMFRKLSYQEQWSVLKITAFMNKKFDILEGLKVWENQYKDATQQKKEN